jgi:hypothetical protein
VHDGKHMNIALEQDGTQMDFALMPDGTSSATVGRAVGRKSDG